MLMSCLLLVSLTLTGCEQDFMAKVIISTFLKYDGLNFEEKLKKKKNLSTGMGLKATESKHC